MRPARSRLESLDAFRGATIAAMILVNNPGDWTNVFPALVHADWNGLTLADVVFPFFVFIMGCAMPFAFARREAESGGDWPLTTRVVRRTFTLIALGLVLNVTEALPHVQAARLPGVLQRIGLAYLGAAIVLRWCGTGGQALIAIALVAGHWAVMTLGSLGAGGAAAITRTHNLAGVIDTLVFGGHTLTPGFDPEGLLGLAPTIATALAGAIAGEWLQREGDHRRQAAGLVAGGVAAICVGLVWSTVWPVNKPLWTGSYALLTSGLAAVSLAVFLYVIDARGNDTWARPLFWLGVNPLALYFCSEFVAQLAERPLLPRVFGDLAPKDWLYWRLFAPLGGTHAEWPSLLFGLVYVAIWVGVAAVLYKKHIRIRV